MNIIDLINQQAAFSRRTFGPGKRTEGVLEHLLKEIEEVRENPHDISEWADIIILAVDGLTRRGFSADDLAMAWHLKLITNENRTWPDYRNYGTDEAITHQPDDWPFDFPKGSILRYGAGPTAIMRADRHNGLEYHSRLYGRQCGGDQVGAYLIDVEVARDEDLAVFREYLCR